MGSGRKDGPILAPGAAAPDFRRRRMLQAMVGAGALGFSRHDATAQSRGLGPGPVSAAADSPVSLLSLPRRALVIGNGKYMENPLRNPASDANAMAGALERIGFEVALLLDAGRDQMRNAIQAYGDGVAKRSAVGLFYFAGHGVQLAWRNYLIPVDAVVDNPDDVRERAVELNTLLQGLTRAKNPMNVIILDACRDNPFGTRVRTEQKGLSQFDAPPGSLLAYATAPGNVASDGEGANGLYTENLLREMRVPEAKIEDIFKRVRLHVRRRTNGQQIPWESTSLEEDFYFVPPAALAALAEEEAGRERERETALREKRRAEEEAERKRKEEQALREARLAAEEAERKRKQELAALERQRIAEEAERNRRRELALKEAQRAAEEAERKRKEEEVLREAKLAEEEAERKYKQEVALREKRRAEEEAERKDKEEQALRESRLAEEEAARKHKQELALREKQRAQEEAERRRERQPAPVGKPDAGLAERQFAEELAIWEKISASTKPGPLEDYLLRYPSGRFSELAQLRLDQVLARQGEKKIQVVSDAKNPYTKGTASADVGYKVGDSYAYRTIDLYTRVEQRTYAATVKEVTDTEVQFTTGLVTDLLGNALRLADGRRFTPRQMYPLEYAVGKRWTSRYSTTVASGQTGSSVLDFRVVGRETVTVPAGTFDAFHIEGRGWTTGTGPLPVEVRIDFWMAPGRVRMPVAREEQRKNALRIIASDRHELVSFRQS